MESDPSGQPPPSLGYLFCSHTVGSRTSRTHHLMYRLLTPGHGPVHHLRQTLSSGPFKRSFLTRAPHAPPHCIGIHNTAIAVHKGYRKNSRSLVFHLHAIVVCLKNTPPRRWRSSNLDRGHNGVHQNLEHLRKLTALRNVFQQLRQLFCFCIGF